ncbi:MAG: PorT family protein [Candidatus Bostrichicola ureolyticus]|nr:MAG: PorT family protein [Candidatus Bostrichicola ureolyticus]
MINNFVKVILLTFIFYSIGCINNIVVNCQQKYPYNLDIPNVPNVPNVPIKKQKFDFKRFNLEYPYIKKISFLVKDMIESEKLKIKKFEFGTKNGINISSIIGIKNSPIFNFNKGFYFKYYLIKSFFIKPELLHSIEGSGIKIKDRPNHIKLTNTYINIPLIFGYTFNNPGISFEFGPQFNLGIDIQTIKGIKALKDVNKLGLSLVAGTEFAIGKYIKCPQLSLTGRYNIGLTKVFASKETFNCNSVFKVGISLKFL